MIENLTRYVPAVVFLLISPVAFGQTEAVNAPTGKNSIQLNFGFTHTRLIDDGYSRKLLFRGTNSTFSLGYARETDHYLFNFSVEGSQGKIKSRSGNLPSDFYFVQPSLEYLRKVNDYRFLDKSANFFAGLSLSSTNYYIRNEYIFDNASLLSLHGIYLSLRSRMLLDEKQQLQITYRLPTVVYVNRLLWNGGASELTYSDQNHLLRTLTTNGSSVWLDLLHNIQWTADYTRRIGRSTNFVIHYEFRYFSRPGAPAVHIYSNGLLVGLKISF